MVHVWGPARREAFANALGDKGLCPLSDPDPDPDPDPDSVWAKAKFRSFLHGCPASEATVMKFSASFSGWTLGPSCIAGTAGNVREELCNVCGAIAGGGERCHGQLGRANECHENQQGLAT